MRHKDRGWTLVELIVVLAISAILAAVVIPTLLGSRTHANDSSASARLDAAVGDLQQVWAEYHTFCVTPPAATTTGPAATTTTAPAATTTTAPGQPGCSAASLTTVMNGLQPGTVAYQTSGTTSGITPPAPPVIQVLGPTAVELGAEAVGGQCLYLEYLEAPSLFLPAGTWYATSPPFADNGKACALSATPVSGWQSSWGQAGA